MQLRELRTSRLNLSVLATAIETRRREEQLSSRELAGRLGVTPSTLTRIRQGKRPDAEALTVLASWAGVAVENLLFPDDPARVGTAPERETVPVADRTQISAGQRAAARRP